jgi:hypothetical protein
MRLSVRAGTFKKECIGQSWEEVDCRTKIMETVDEHVMFRIDGYILYYNSMALTVYDKKAVD